jgi:hypothetical protein
MTTTIHHLRMVTLRPAAPPPPGLLVLLVLVCACLKGCGG